MPFIGAQGHTRAHFKILLFYTFNLILFVYLAFRSVGTSKNLIEKLVEKR